MTLIHLSQEKASRDILDIFLFWINVKKWWEKGAHEFMIEDTSEFHKGKYKMGSEERRV